MSHSIDNFYEEAKKRLQQERDRAVEKIKEELDVAKRKTLSK